MQPEQPLNKLTPTDCNGLLAVAEAHALACWAALERHIQSKNLYRDRQRCGCYKHDYAGHIVVVKTCDVGEACAEEYEIASRRVREIKAAAGLEAGDMGSTLEDVRP